MPYAGPADGFRQFEFLDCQGPDGRFGRCRAFYLFGSIFPGLHFYCETPVVRWADAVAIDVLSSVSAWERQQIARIAETSGLGFFAVDFLRPRDPQARPVFVDINVFPAVRYFPITTGYFGGWHEFDFFTIEASARTPRPSAWDMIDAGIADLLEGNRPGLATGLQNASNPVTS